MDVAEHKLVAVHLYNQRWTGQWFVEGKDLHLWSAWGAGITPLRGREPAAAANSLLTKLVREWNRKRP
jgi:hypothetical protein